MPRTHPLGDAPPPPPRRVGGHPAVDFVNTVDPHRAEPDYLTDYPRLLAWSEVAGVLTRAEAQALTAEAAAHPQMAALRLTEALSLRGAITDLCVARAEGRTASKAELAAFNALLTRRGATGELARDGLGFVRTRAASAEPLAEPIRRLVELAADFFASADFARLRRCEGENCGWCFVDRSPGGRRRWCSMESCGNRAKAHRHYRKRARAEAG